MNNCYLYRHIRLDKNEPFYVGIGGLGEFDDYGRAYTLSGRNDFWKRIVKKTRFEVEILFNNLSLKEAFEKEIEFIKLHGRRDLNLGTLCNLTSGGEGSPGVIPSEETRLKMSKIHKGRPLHENVRKVFKALTESRKGKTRSQKEIENIRKSVKGKNKGEKNGFYGKTQSQKALETHSKKVLNLETGIYYDSAKEASKTTNIGYSLFRTMLNGRSPNKTCFIYVNERIYDKPKNKK